MISRWLRQLVASPPPAHVETRVFTAPEGMRIYAVGDIHGKSALLTLMLDAIAKDAQQYPNAHVVEVFLGDYIDRGMGSREVIDQLISPSPQGHTRVCLKGNHEETLLRFLEQPTLIREWANYGGYATLASYGIGIPQSMSPDALLKLRDAFKANLPIEHETFLRKLSLSYSAGDYLFVHAGIHPTVALDEQKAEHLLWIREPFLSHRGFFDQYVVHGHSPVSAPDIHNHRANLDVSAAMVDSLCCLVIEGNARHSFVVHE